MESKVKKGTLIAVPITAIVAFSVALYINLSNQTAVAIQVARDHGTELKTLRLDYSLLRSEMKGMREDLRDRMDDRFRGSDAQAMEDRLTERIRNVEGKVDRHH